MMKIVSLALLATLTRAVKLTNSAYDVVPGKAFTITWTEAQGPVTLRLKSGPQTNLETVEEITSGQSGESFTWNGPSDFDGRLYALEIEDESGDVNYSVQFPIEGDGSSKTGSITEASVTFSTAAQIFSEPAITELVTPSTTDGVKDQTTGPVTRATEPASPSTTLETRTDAESESLSELDTTATESSESSGTESNSARFTVLDSSSSSRYDISAGLGMIAMALLVGF
ncbi:GPI-anchored domain-containing protein [Fusarium sp. LHS14.1]|nr:GPI-anchored domain-containing protein [Fusarium sp. LHS14.1]